MTAYNDLIKLGNAQFAKLHCATKGYYCIESIKSNHIQNCAISMINTIEGIVGNSFDINEIEYFGDTNIKILDYEDTQSNNNRFYSTLSLISISLIDLGILQVQ